MKILGEFEQEYICKKCGSRLLLTLDDIYRIKGSFMDIDVCFQCESCAAVNIIKNFELWNLVKWRPSA